MTDSLVLARMDIAADPDDLGDAERIAPARCALRSVSAGPVWFYLDSSREWFWRDEENRYWLVHSAKRGVALPQMEFWIPKELRAMNPRARKGPKIPREARILVEGMTGPAEKS